MSEAKFTKGAWFIEKGANWNDARWAISVKRDCDDSVHHCFAEAVYKMEHEERNLELEANVHLIAAAPEMYDLLEQIRHGDTDFIGYDMYSKIDQLLAKARGEQ